jgi:hypothetical protein
MQCRLRTLLMLLAVLPPLLAGAYWNWPPRPNILPPTLPPMPADILAEQNKAIRASNARPIFAPGGPAPIVEDWSKVQP